MVTKNSTTINLTGEEQTVQFDRSYPYFWVQNLGDKDVFISIDGGIVEGADGVIAVPAGGSCGTMHGCSADKLYLLGSGKVQVMGTGSAFNPFKAAQKGGGSEAVVLYATLSASEWSDTAPYTQTVEVNGITADMSPIVDIVFSDDAETVEAEQAAWSCITKAVTSDGSIIFYCYDTIPDVDLNFKVKAV